VRSISLIPSAATLFVISLWIPILLLCGRRQPHLCAVAADCSPSRTIQAIRRHLENERCALASQSRCT
jgi:hypothetical protein